MKKTSEFESIENMLYRADFSKESNKKAVYDMMKNNEMRDNQPKKMKKLNTKVIIAAACVIALAAGFSTTAYAKSLMLMIRNQFTIGKNTHIIEIENNSLEKGQSIEMTMDKTGIATSVKAFSSDSQTVGDVASEKIDLEKAKTLLGGNLPQPGYVPAGYEVESIETLSAKNPETNESQLASVNFTYANADKANSFVLRVMPLAQEASGGANVAFATDVAAQRKTIAGKEVAIFGTSVIVWESGSYSYSLEAGNFEAPIAQEELEKIMASIQ